ncbi:hypothetical protein, partial [Enterococcus faecalis]|uniref:hypothetical protein n=1 Tax=Enterococcus faecalis TaxID=1351 RepID=UPI003D6AA3A6
IQPRDGDRGLVVPLVRSRDPCDPTSPAEFLRRAPQHHARVRAALPPEAWALSRGEAVLETVPA